MTAVMIAAEVATLAGFYAVLNFSTRRVGGIRFIKIGRLCLSFCVTREYRPM